MEQYIVTGMSCAACAARVEKAVNGVEGVDSCSVSLLTNSMGVEGTASASAVIAAVEKAGYGAKLKDGDKKESGVQGDGTFSAEEEALADHETPVLKRRLISSVGFLLVLMYFSMGHMMWGWPVPAFFEGNCIAVGLLEMLLAIVVMLINGKFFTSGFKAVINGAPNMDTLVAMGSGVSFAYSTVVLFMMTGVPEAERMALMDNFYFESAAMIVTLITVGKMLEAMSKGRTTSALKSLILLAPKTATILRDGAEVTVPVGEVRKGDFFVVRPGENIPVDGIVIEGESAVNEAALTGESIPVDKAAGDGVSAATINQSGFLKCEATRVGEDTTLSQIIKMVSDAAATKAPIAKIADKVSGIFVPAVMAIALVVFVIWLLTGASFSFALGKAICVLVISCPCALGLATPVAIMVGNGIGAKNGILFKTSAALEETGRIETVVLDKTGTITSGEPMVTDVVPGEGISEATLLSFAGMLEAKSEHPLAKAVLKYTEENDLPLPEVSDFKALPGNGLTAAYEGKKLVGGSRKYIESLVALPAEISRKAQALSEEGKTPLFFLRDDTLLGMIAVADVMKEDSPEAIRQLKQMGIRVVMLTGDNRRTAEAIGKMAGVDAVIADVLPDGKEQQIRTLMEMGKTAMVGDGINDAPALTRADIGIAIGAGADVAIDAADVVITKSRLTDVAAAIRLSRATLKNIHENLFWAFFYNIICIPLAAGAWYHTFGISLNPMIGAAAMSLSSFCVVTNALRLNFLKLYDASKDKPLRKKGKNRGPESGKAADQATEDRGESTARLAASLKETTKTNDKETEKLISEKENETMTKTMEIKGMMCMHCEARVKKALEAVDGVSEAAVSHETGTAVVTLTKDVEDAALTKAVTDADYEVVSVK